MLFGGCTNETVDTEFLCEEKEPVIIYEPAIACDPVPCEQTVFGHLTNEWLERIDSSNVKLNHYINEVKFEENTADIIDLNGQLTTSNPITIPEYVGVPMKHVLVVEFMQTN